MVLISPLWLLGLLPWAGVTAWLLWGRRQRTLVPFLPLWRGPAPVPRAKRSVQLPPAAVVFAILSMLLAVLAAARPAIARSRLAKANFVVVIDRGLTMSARGTSDPRYREAGARLASDLAALFEPATPVQWIAVPAGTIVFDTVATWRSKIDSIVPSARTTRQAMRVAVLGELASSADAVIAISDQDLRIADERLVQVSPQTTPSDVAVTRLAVGESPTVQAMVRVRNQSPQTRGELVVSSSGESVRRSIALPPRGQERNYFVDLKRAGQTVDAEVRVEDDQPANNRAWLVREANWPRLEPAAALPPEVRRVAQAYEAARPPGDASRPVPLVGAVAQLPSRTSGVVVASAMNELSVRPDSLRVVPHPVTSQVDWDKLPALLRVANLPEGEWTPLVTVGGRVLVAARQADARQVWVGFDAGPWSATPAFVVLWTNVFDWLGQGGESYTSHPLAEWTPEWKPRDFDAARAGLWPGLYVRSDGALRAFDAADVPIQPPFKTDWQEKLKSIAQKQRGSFDLAPLLALAAAGCLVLSAMTWKKRNKRSSPRDSDGRREASLDSGLTAFSAGRTF